jgi:hypothetical protein
LHQNPLEYHYALIEFHENLPRGSKVISGGQTDSHFGMIEVIFNAITTIKNFIQMYHRCTLLRSLNVHHFEMVEATRLNSMQLRSSSTSCLLTQCHPNPPIRSKVAPPQKFKHPPFWSD